MTTEGRSLTPAAAEACHSGCRPSAGEPTAVSTSGAPAAKSTMAPALPPEPRVRSDTNSCHSFVNKTPRLACRVNVSGWHHGTGRRARRRRRRRRAWPAARPARRAAARPRAPRRTRRQPRRGPRRPAGRPVLGKTRPPGTPHQLLMWQPEGALRGLSDLWCADLHVECLAACWNSSAVAGFRGRGGHLAVGRPSSSPRRGPRPWRRPGRR